MKALAFDRISRDLGQSSTRRSFFRLLGGAAAVGVVAAAGLGEESQAKKKKPSKITICYQGQTRQAPKRGWQNRFPGAKRGACSGQPSGGSGSGGTGPANPVTSEDAACPGPGGGTFGTATANARFAQTFTARASGQLVTAQVTLIKEANTNGDYVATINTVDANGVPTNTVLATASIPNANAVAGESTASFGFPNPATVVAGTQYALVISRTGPAKLTLRGDGSNRCIGGAFDSPNQTAAFLSTGPAIDFDFKTFVRA